MSDLVIISEQLKVFVWVVDCDRLLELWFYVRIGPLFLSQLYTVSKKMRQLWQAVVSSSMD